MLELNNNFYCSEKFTWLSVDLEKRELYSCCAAQPEKININWLKQNSGQLFNTPNLQQERQDMLNNKPVASCGIACWTPEQQGLESRRLQYKTYELTHNKVTTTQPETLNIMLGSTCNLTCSYCCKQYSTAWTRDIQENGTYFDDSRFNLVESDLILSQVSQNDHRITEGFRVLLSELACYTNLKEVIITGGEPFLYNSFPDLINKISANNTNFFTGLGVDSNRLITQLSRIDNAKNITACVSAENCNQFYEFNRYGNSYQKFVTNLNILQSHMNVKFGSVLSNLTIHGLIEFVELHPDQDTVYNFCNNPDYLGLNVMDPDTKEFLSRSISDSNIKLKDSIITTMMKPCSETQRQQFSSYLSQFSQRRNLKLDIFPPSMLKWLNIT